MVLAQDDRVRFSSIADLVRDVRLHGYYGGIRLVKATIKTFADYCRRTGRELHERNFSVRYTSDVPRQVGMAGSSAIIVATLRCLMEFYDLRVPLEVQPSLALAVERDELGIGAGLQDRVIQVYEGVVAMDFDPARATERDGFATGVLRAAGRRRAAAGVPGLQRRRRRADRGVPQQPAAAVRRRRRRGARRDGPFRRLGGRVPCRAGRRRRGPHVGVDRRELRPAGEPVPTAAGAGGDGRGGPRRRRQPPSSPAAAARSSACSTATPCSSDSPATSSPSAASCSARGSTAVLEARQRETPSPREDRGAGISRKAARRGLGWAPRSGKCSPERTFPWCMA